ncbi:MAG: type II toxin-antitoxin system RelB/DinJ family antitoxin [Coxiellaceae bacterium]|nr:type II toxin-antitoxin system RelB/DinJ family antitoxin [Coxiellaceae bacterium]
MRTETVRAKVSHKTKVDAERVLERLGLSMSEAINLMLIQIKMRKGLPFEITLPNTPNAETKKVLDETDKGKGLITCKNEKDLFDQLGI